MEVRRSESEEEAAQAIDADLIDDRPGLPQVGRSRRRTTPPGIGSLVAPFNPHALGYPLSEIFEEVARRKGVRPPTVKTWWQNAQEKTTHTTRWRRLTQWVLPRNAAARFILGPSRRSSVLTAHSTFSMRLAAPSGGTCEWLSTAKAR